MFRKLTKLLFNEEEIVSDETKKTPVGEAHQDIPKLKSFSHETPAEPVLETADEAPVVEKKKPMMITIEDQPLEPVVKKSKIQRKQTQYEPQEVLSPIYGSKEKKSSEKVVSSVQGESRRLKSSVISPMFGNVAYESEDTALIFEDLSLEAMLEKDEAQEVQVSFFDFDKEESK